MCLKIDQGPLEKWREQFTESKIMKGPYEEDPNCPPPLIEIGLTYLKI